MITLALCLFVSALAYSYGRSHGWRFGFNYAADNCHICTSFAAMEPNEQALFLSLAKEQA